MSCCGNSRVPPAPRGRAGQAYPAAGASAQMARRTVADAVYFQYIGKTALRVRGMFSQRTYRFDVPMTVLEVDRRDAASMAAVPLLKRVAAPQ